MKIEMLGNGCAKCRQFHENVTAALEKLGREDVEIIVTGSPERLAFYSLLTLPALAIDETVVLKGEVPDVNAFVKLLS